MKAHIQGKSVTLTYILVSLTRLGELCFICLSAPGTVVGTHLALNKQLLKKCISIWGLG